MAECERLAKCAFFKDEMASMPATAELMKDTYCKVNFESCARYMVAQALGKEAVPLDLYPAERDKAQLLIEEKQKRQKGKFARH